MSLSLVTLFPLYLFGSMKTPFTSILYNAPPRQFSPSALLLFTKSNINTYVNICRFFSSNNILAAPVFDKANDNFLGFVDMMDLLANVVSFYSERQSTDAKQGEG